MRYLKEFSTFLFMGSTGVWAHWSLSFDMHLMYLRPVFCVFISWASSGFTIESGCRVCLLDGTYSFPSLVFSGLTCSGWRAAITDNSDILLYWFDRKYSISQSFWVLYIVAGGDFCLGCRYSVKGSWVPACFSRIYFLRLSWWLSL